MFRKAKARVCSAAFESFVRRRSRSEPVRPWVPVFLDLRIRGGHRRKVSSLGLIARLRVEGITGQRETGKIRDVIQIRVILEYLLISFGGFNICLIFPFLIPL